MASTSSNNPFHPSPPPPSPDTHPTVIVIVFISFGCFFLLGALFLCIWWFMKKRTERKKKLVHERKDIDVDEHRKVQEMIVPGPCGPKKVLVSVEDDIHVHEDVHKSEIDLVGKGLHGKHEEGVASGSSQHLSLPERQV